MGRSITATYLGAYITHSRGFQAKKRSDEFYDEYYDSDVFRTAYEGLDDVDVLIPAGQDYAIVDDIEYSGIVADFAVLEELEERLRRDYAATIARLIEKYPDGAFKVSSGLVCYFDEVA